MKILQSLKKKLKIRTSITPEKYYKSIKEISLFNWLECVDGNYQFARTKQSNKEVNQADFEAWQVIYDSYINTFGINPFYEKYLKLSIKIANAKLNYVQTKNKFNFNIIRVFEAELETLKSQMKEGVSSQTILNALSKMQRQRIDPKTYTAYEYFSLIKDYERNN